MIMHGFLTDWVTEFKPEYPHVVNITLHEHTVSDMHSWLRTHVGDRDCAWQFPKTDTYMFKHEDHAIQFSLIWGGA